MTVIMDETNTFVTWPSRLKIGAKSKKDPHIKVAGRLDDVRAAKEKIMQILDTRQSMRVTMKLDVSYTDHSHIIGKGGLTIKRVMEETGCHIHFPDSNRSNHQEKSNQVSIAGEMEGVEKARARVRSLTPLIFSFELPIMRSMQSQPDSTSPYIIKIQEKYNVQVMFRTRPKLHATLVVVKGCEWEVPQVKEATLFLIHHMCKNLANQIQVQMSMEISPQHHSIVLGKQSNNLKLIMQRTSTQIMFPDAGDPNIPSLKKSNVMITGSIHNVYLARQQLVGSLPLVLMFDLPENSMQTVDTENISQLMQTLDVFINVRHKPKQSTLSVIIKGVERNATNIYEARRQLLNLEEPMIEAKLPLSLQIPKNLFQGNSGNTKPGSFMGMSENFNNMLSINTQNQSPFCLSPLSVSPNGLSPQWNIPPQVSSMFSPLLHPSFSYNHPNAQLLAATRAAMQSNILNQQAMNLPGQNLLGLGRSHPPGFPPNAYQSGNNDSIGSSSKSGSLSDNKETNYMSISSTSSTLSSPAISPRNVSPIESADISMNLGYNTSVLSDLSMLEEKTEQKKLEIGTTHLMPFDYEQKKLLALKAIQNKPKSSEYRIPTPTWSGYGLSQTMPAVHTPTEKTANESKCSISDPSDLWDDPTTPLVYMGQVIDFDTNRKESMGMNSLYIDHTPQSRLNKIISGAHTDLTTTLNSVGLEKYIRTFSSHEIDMSTFLSLTDKDLTEIGITAWGARRKILLLISEMNKRTKPFSGSAAPGAERKSSLTNVSTTVNENNMEGKW